MELLRKWLGHPEDIYNLLRFKMGGYRTVMPRMDTDSLGCGLRTCYRYLNQTSRSFAAVIQALDGELRHAVCIFYLVLRALDTVEDDMSIPLDVKVPMLHEFHSYLYQPDWKYTESKEKDRQVLEDFPTISMEFRNLSKVYQDVISDICHKMGVGMAEFLEKKVDSEREWDKYCHYVAGLVGIGLSRLFSASELEDSIVGQDTDLANSMGLFLQKTNIIRDYLEDQLEGREFWPREVWSRYAKKLSDFAKPENIDMAVQCLNELITNALHHVPDVLTYLSRLKNQSVFNFCAIPSGDGHCHADCLLQQPASVQGGGEDPQGPGRHPHDGCHEHPSCQSHRVPVCGRDLPEDPEHGPLVQQDAAGRRLHPRRQPARQPHGLPPPLLPHLPVLCHAPGSPELAVPQHPLQGHRGVRAGRRQLKGSARAGGQVVADGQRGQEAPRPLLWGWPGTEMVTRMGHWGAAGPGVTAWHCWTPSSLPLLSAWMAAKADWSLSVWG
uniref:Squalene synthase n=1 Tax=Taeniopygia guttata TaxID=59729 RepID=A0A674HAJ2_TAEGU